MQLTAYPRTRRTGKEDGPAVYPFCRQGRLRLVGEKPYQIYGTLGMTECTLRCDEPDCGKLVIEP